MTKMRGQSLGEAARPAGRSKLISMGNLEECEIGNFNMGFFSWVTSNLCSISLD